MKHKRNKKGDGNNSLFDLAVGIAMSDENEELEERIKTLTRELDEKNKNIDPRDLPWFHFRRKSKKEVKKEIVRSGEE